MSVDVGRKQNTKNLMLNIVAFGVQFIISFYISPVIVSSVGSTAYGFIGMANDFVSYASILTSVFNSVAARFIADAFYRKEFDKANKYFNSLIVTNLVIAAGLGAVGIVLVPNLDKFISIPASIMFDVKLTFALVFAAYIVTLITLVFTTSTYVTNRTDIQGVRNIIQYIIRFALIIIFLNFLSVHIYWVSVASLIATIVVAIMNVSLTKRLTPELSINLKNASKQYALILGKSGCWLALTSLSNVLLSGLDLTVTNIFIGDYEMGLLSIARTMPNHMTSVVNTLAPIFTPVFISYYSRGDHKGLLKNVKNSVNTMALILFVPISGFIIFSYDFYKLWQSSLTEQELIIVTVLSILTIIQTYFNAVTAPMAQVSVVVNKLKLPVIVSLICGVLSVAFELFLIKFTGLGVYSIVISTSIILIIRYAVFNSVYAAWCVGEKKFYFLPSTVKTWVSIPCLCIGMYFVRKIMPISSWTTFLVDVVICAALGYIFMALIYGRNEVKSVILKIKGKIGK